MIRSRRRRSPAWWFPPNRIYAPGQALLNLFPLPNVTQVSNFNYTSQLPGKSPRRETLLRLDYNVTRQSPRLRPLDRRSAADRAPYGSFVLGLTVPITNIANPDSGKQLRGRRDLDHQPDHDQRGQLGLHAQLDPHR